MYVEYRCAALLMSMIVGSIRAMRPYPTPSRRATILDSGFGWTDADAVDNSM